MVVVPVGAAVVVVPGVVVLGAVPAPLVVVDGTVKVWPPETEKPAVLALAECRFGAPGAAGCRAAGLGFRAGDRAGAGCGIEFVAGCVVTNGRCLAR